MFFGIHHGHIGISLYDMDELGVIWRRQRRIGMNHILHRKQSLLGVATAKGSRMDSVAFVALILSQHGAHTGKQTSGGAPPPVPSANKSLIDLAGSNSITIIKPTVLTNKDNSFFFFFWVSVDRSGRLPPPPQLSSHEFIYFLFYLLYASLQLITVTIIR